MCLFQHRRRVLVPYSLTRTSLVLRLQAALHIKILKLVEVKGDKIIVARANRIVVIIETKNVKRLQVLCPGNGGLE